MTEYKKNSTKRSIATIFSTLLLCTTPILEFSTNSFGTFSPFLFFCILLGLLLGGIQGAGSIGLYIILGCTGLKIFPNSNKGIEFLISSQGGILIAGFICSLIAGRILGTPHHFESSNKNKQSIKILITIIISTLLAIITWLTWFIIRMPGTNKNIVSNIYSVFNYEILPQLPFTIISLIPAFFIALYLRPSIGKFLYPNDKKEMENLISKLKTKKK